MIPTGSVLHFPQGFDEGHQLYTIEVLAMGKLSAEQISSSNSERKKNDPGRPRAHPSRVEGRLTGLPKLPFSAWQIMLEKNETKCGRPGLAWQNGVIELPLS
jgi:hypothetical protein